MIACLSCNGETVTHGEGPATTLLVATIRGVHIFRRDAPDSPWLLRERQLTDLHISALLWEPHSGMLFAGAHGAGGLWVSSDQGRNWSPRADGIEHRHIYSLALQYRGESAVLFVGTEPAALYRSDDLGASWQELAGLCKVPGTERWTFPPPPHLAHVKNIAFHPSAPETLYVCIEQGALLKSVDDGQTWFEEAGYASNEDFFENDNHRVRIRRSNANELFMCGGEGLYFSANAGREWQHLTGRDHRVGYPDAMFIDPHDDNAIYMAGPRFAPRRWGESGVADPTVMRSLDGGHTWSDYREGLPKVIRGNIEAMGLHYWSDGIMLVAGTATGEVFIREPADGPWSLLADNLPAVSKGGHYRWFLSSEERARIETRIGAE